MESKRDLMLLPKVGKRDIVQYLGSYISINENKECLTNIIQEIDKIACALKPKRISSNIASYIVNSIIIPTVTYRLIGCEAPKHLYKKINSICSSILKTTINLACSYPNSFLQTKFMPTYIRNSEDVHEEQEIGNFLYWINSDEEIGTLLRSVIKDYEKCHPALTEQVYKTRSRYINFIWRISTKNNFSIQSNETVRDINEKTFACQFIASETHEEQALFLK